MPTGKGARSVVGREAELRIVNGWVEALHSGQAAGPLILRGPTGIGKSTLWVAALERFQGVGGRALTTRPTESEVTLGYAGLTDLLAPNVDIWRPVIPDHLAKALAQALLLAPRESEFEGLAVSRGAQLALEAIAAEGPVLIGIDDVQWLDPATARTLSYALRRWLVPPIGLAVAWRESEDDPLDLLRLTEEFTLVEVGPLSKVDIEKLVFQHRSPGIDANRLRAIDELSNGNPFYAIELARAAESGALPASLAAAANARLDAATPIALPAIELVAVSGPRPEAVFAARGMSASLDAAVRDAILIESEGVIRFDHPLLTWVAYQRIPPARRRLLHEEVARSASSVEERAGHIARATISSDASAAALMDEAYDSAQGRHASEAAAEFAAEAVRLTPPDDIEQRAARLTNEAEARFEFDRATADQLADQILATGVRGSIRAAALLIKGDATRDMDEAERFSIEACRESGIDPAVRVMEQADQAWVRGAIRGDLDRAWTEMQPLINEVDQVGSQPASMTVLALAGFIASLRGDPEADTLFGQAMVLVNAGVKAEHYQHVRVHYARHLARHGSWSRAIELLNEQEVIGNAEGDDWQIALSLATRGSVELRHGNWDELDVILSTAEGITRRRYQPFGASIIPVRALLMARRGDMAALAVADSLPGDSHEAFMLAPLSLKELCRGILGVSRGQSAESAQAFAGLAERLPTSGRLRDELVCILPDAVIATVAAGQIGDAETLVSSLAHPSRHEPLTTATELLCRGLLTLASNDASAAAGDLKAAAAFAEHIDARWLAAQARYAEGMALKRLGHRTKAAEALEQAAERFAQFGAMSWHEQALGQRLAARPLPHDDTILTTAERKVAELASLGRSNREIAAELFITIATVEAHLTRVYRKLGVRSRGGLAHAMASVRDTNAGPDV